jgi:predicted phosphate transport protein (TIGR00153 family)
VGMLNWEEQSPFEPLNQHLRKVRQCVDLLMPMFECVRAGDYQRLQQIADDIFKREHEADVIKNDIRATIPKAFALPVFRGDLLAYLHVQDDMADSVEDLAVMLTLKELSLPAALSEDVMDYVRKVLDVCERLYRASDLLRDLNEEDLAGERADRVLSLVAEAERAEWEADKCQYALARKLFALEDEMRPTDIYLWSSVMRELGKLANHADKTAERLRRMLAR